jgi:glycosyltransferase involved in cell wall biosynthesis
MKNILIISLNALPMDVISSYRAKAYCDHLFGYDIYPTLLTSRYEKKEDGSFAWQGESDEIFEEVYDTHRIIRLPRVKPEISKSPCHTLVNMAKGNFDVELMPTYRLYKKFLFRHLESQSYDFVLSIFSPHFHLKLAYELKKHFGVPYVLDFRDLWGMNRVVKIGYKPSIKEKIQDTLILFWWRIWIRDAQFYTIVNDYFLEFLKKSASNKNGYVVRNGIEELYPIKDVSFKPFTIIYFGAIYPEQDLAVFFQGVKQLIELYPEEEIFVEFIGLKERYRPNVIEEIRNSLPEKNLIFTPSMPKNELLVYCQKASLFYYPAFQNIEGWFSAKLYDYMALGKEILVVPGGNIEVEEIIKITKTGKILNSAEDVTEFLKIKVEELKSTTKIAFSPIFEQLKKFTREAQVRRMASLIRRYSKEKE